MSFLNPVNEPVLRFSSTDADAPQINYAARVAGDVKTVLKACLVTGYGAKSSAGWSVVNEVNHVAEFVSPSAAMSDYRLGIDDTSASSTTWYYQYQNTKVDLTYASIKKTISQINKTSADNKWALLVTDRGLLFIEIFALSAGGLGSRVTYYGAVKSAIAASVSKNIALWCVGADAPVTTPTNFLSNTKTYAHCNLGLIGSVKFASANIATAASSQATTISNIDLTSDIYLTDDTDSLIAKQPALLLKTSVGDAEFFNVVESNDIDGRPTISIPVVGLQSTAVAMIRFSVHFVVYLDYWEY